MLTKTGVRIAVGCLGTEINEFYVFAMKERIKTTSKLIENINADWETLSLDVNIHNYF